MKRKVLIFSVDLVPIPGYPVSGGGLRAWGLGEGLKSRGHEVFYSVPKTAFSKDKKNPKDLTQYAYDIQDLNSVVERVLPDIVLFEQWGLATYLRDPKIPVVIDLHGSLTLENIYRERSNIATDTLTKIRTLRNADLIICPGEMQRMYFLSWMIMSGFDPKDIGIEVIPVSFSPDLPRRKKSRELEFIFGGNFWPWIDPFPCLNILVDKIEKEKKGKLSLFTGIMKYQERSELIGDDIGVYNIFLNKIKKSQRCEQEGFLSHSQLLNRYKHASVAVDVYKKNLEREIAFTTRTVEYLWCGLPVIYGNYAELAFYIKDYNAGWVVDPDDESSIQKVLDQIFKNEQIIEEYGENAHRLVRDKFTWDKTIEPLDRYCRNPVFRKKNKTILTGFKDHLDLTELELKKSQEAFKTLQDDADKRVNSEKAHAREMLESLNKHVTDRDIEIKRLHDLNENLLKEKDSITKIFEKRIGEIKQKNEEKITLLEKEKLNLIDKIEISRVRSAEKIDKLNDRIFHLIEQFRPEIERLNDQIKEKQDLLLEHKEKAENLSSILEKKAESINEKDKQISALQEDLQAKTDFIEKANFDLNKYKQEAELLNGILRGIKNKKSYKINHFFKTGLKRVFLNYPRLFYLFFVNILTNAYMSRWVKKNNQRIFPGQ